MGLLSRAMNTGYHVLLQLMHVFMVKFFLEDVLRSHFGPSMPPVYAMSRNVSFTLQNAHATVSYPRPYLPNVAEVACIHCKAPKPLDQDLEEFIYGAGDAGFIYVSMGSSVRSANMPEYLRLLFVRAFAQLPYRVVWKWEEGGMPDLPHNVKLSRWLPQQDILGQWRQPSLRPRTSYTFSVAVHSPQQEVNSTVTDRSVHIYLICTVLNP
ncbi:unnamed protein product [Timema podura]|uniref:Uncharacterized protein n=1 Tax=Timema podura TaxID=61482 RepID=A0ABN7PUA1_TIMPD|nr:unnamed protein product [Timema podura]